MTDREMKLEAARKKAEALRWKKPLVKEMNLEEIRGKLYEMDEACGNVTWYLGKGAEELEDILGEDDAQEYKNSYSALQADIERMLGQVDDIWIPEYFDDFLAACRPDGTELLGYDSYEEDFFSIGSSAAAYAAQKAKERMERKTKSELIDCAHVVIGILVQYMAVKYRFDSLGAAFDVLMDRSQEELQAVLEIEEAWAEADKEGFDSWKDGTRKLDALLTQLPEKTWLE